MASGKIFLFYFLDDVIMIEHKIFFETYVHYLRSLKKADPDQLPFSDNLVRASK